MLLHLIQVYEDSLDLPFPTVSPLDTLRHLMEQRGLRLKDLTPVFGTASVVSEVLRGKRKINAGQAKRLGEFFRLPADVFL